MIENANELAGVGIVLTGAAMAVAIGVAFVRACLDERAARHELDPWLARMRRALGEDKRPGRSA